MYKKELKQILNIIEEKHIDMYFNITKEELNKYVEELLNKHELKDEYDLYYYTNVIIKKIFDRFDSHTYLIWNDADFNLPIRLRYIDNKLYITRTDEDNIDLLYGQILKINNVDINKLIEEIKAMTAYSTDGYLQIKIETILYNGIKLMSLPSIDSNTKEFEYEILIDNKIVKRKLTKQTNELIDLNKWKKNYSYEIIDNSIYIVYNACKEDYKGQMQELVNNIKQKSEEKNIENFIIDLRGNMGGNADYIKPLIEFLKGKKVVTLTNNYIFSGGRWALIDLKNIGSKFIGTEIGTTLNCFGNIKVERPSKYILPVSEKYFYYDENSKSIKQIKEKEDFIEFKNNIDNQKYFEPQIFEPDYYVENTIEDYKNQYDRQLDSALLLINTRMKNDRKEQFLKIQTPEELMEYLDNNISYGWIDRNGKKYINTLSHVRENYRTGTINEIFETGLVTCAEDAKLIKYCLDRLGYETKLYCHRAYETEENFDQTVKMHCFVLFKKDNYWYHFEHSMTPIKGIHKYDTIEEALNWITSKWNKNERKLAEIDDIPDYLTFKELNQYVNQFDIKEFNKTNLR